ncbi:MAG: hypothetical protein OXG36_10595, partial [Caldilineaceae bacterium]|nr:hypothetical protein [Caldilineaceae bacterium]
LSWTLYKVQLRHRHVHRERALTGQGIVPGCGFTMLNVEEYSMVVNAKSSVLPACKGDHLIGKR